MHYVKKYKQAKADFEHQRANQIAWDNSMTTKIRVQNPQQAGTLQSALGHREVVPKVRKELPTGAEFKAQNWRTTGRPEAATDAGARIERRIEKTPGYRIPVIGKRIFQKEYPVDYYRASPTSTPRRITYNN